MPTFRLAVIGGCMTHQRGIPLNELYHRRLADLLEARSGIRLKVRVVRAFEADMATRLDLLGADPEVDGVLVHLRAWSLIAPVPIFRRAWHGGRRRIELNPVLRRSSEAAWTGADLDADAYGEAPDRQDTPPPGRRVAGMRIRSANIGIGCLLGFDRRALRAQLRQLDAFAAVARDRHLPFFVLGPTPATYSYWTNRCVDRANAAIPRRLAGSGVPFALIERKADRDGVSLTRADGTHLTIEGQGYVAERLYEAGIGGWMSDVIATRPGALDTAASVSDPAA
jgi:hypothetical protein